MFFEKTTLPCLSGGGKLDFPAVSICPDDDGNQVRSTLLESWSRLAVANRDHLEEMVEQILQRSTDDVCWWEDPELGWITDAFHSFRNPKDLRAFDPDRSRKVAAFFAGIGTDS